MRKEWLMLSASVVVTLLLTLGLTRWFAPQLLLADPKGYCN